MAEIQVTGVSKYFGEKKVLDNISFEVYERERVGLIGRNGAGKTTLFSIITRALEPDAGSVSVAAGRRVGIMTQIPEYPHGFLVEDVLRTAFKRAFEIKAQMEALEREMQSDHSKQTLMKYDRLMALFESSGGYSMDTDTDIVANGLSISPAMRALEFELLSGGEKTRVNLAKLILENTEILLLDEPTNHLDMRSCQWLEDYLSRFKGTVLAVSHDRYFLERAISRLIEIENGRAEFFSGSYGYYTAEKEARISAMMEKREREETELKRLEETSRWMHQKGTEHMHKRAFSIDKRAERLRQGMTEAYHRQKSMRSSFKSRELFADDVLIAKGVTKSYDGRTLFSGLELEVGKGERVAIIGGNGTGKTTLLKILLSEEAPDSGYVVIGDSVRKAYLPQIVRFPHPERNLIDTVIYEQNCSAQTARNVLASHLFRGDDAFKSVSVLSGGELSRLKLCCLMSESINLLLLDEPTNHLDIASREWMEEALSSFEGTLIFVSHDRYFINRFATRVWELEDGKILDFIGDYDEFAAYKRRMDEQNSGPSAAAPAVAPFYSQRGKKKKPKGRSGADAEREIEALEKKLFDLELSMESASSDYERLSLLLSEHEELKGMIDVLYTEWENLTDGTDD